MLSKVFGIKKDGTVLSAESETRNHNDMSKDLYSSYVERLTEEQKEISSEPVKSYWPISGAVVKNRKDLIFLELKGEGVDTPFCIVLVPKGVLRRQISVAKQRYGKMNDMYFIDQTNCNGDEFVNNVNFEPFDSLWAYLNNQCEKEQVEPDIDIF